MTENRESDRRGNRWCEYRVIATVEYGISDGRSVTDTVLYDMESAWINDKRMAVDLAESLRDAGHSVEIQTRRRGSYAPKDFEALPDRGGSG